MNGKYCRFVCIISAMLLGQIVLPAQLKESSLHVLHEYNRPVVAYTTYLKYPQMVFFPKCGSDSLGMTITTPIVKKGNHLYTSLNHIDLYFDPSSVGLYVNDDKISLSSKFDGTGAKRILYGPQMLNIRECTESALFVEGLDEEGYSVQGWFDGNLIRHKKGHWPNCFVDTFNNYTASFYSDPECTQIRMVVYPFYEEGDAGVEMFLKGSSVNSLEVEWWEETLYCRKGILVVLTGNPHGSSANLYSSPDKSSACTVVESNLIAQIYDKDGDWVFVRIKDDSGMEVSGWMVLSEQNGSMSF